MCCCCRQWHRVVYGSRQLWRSVHILPATQPQLDSAQRDPSAVERSTRFWISHVAPHIRSLTDDRTDADGTLMDALVAGGATQLGHLTLSNFGAPGADSLLADAARLAALCSLELTVQVETIAPKLAHAQLQSLSQVTELSIDMRREYGTTCTMHVSLPHELSGMAALQRLSLSCIIDDEEFSTAPPISQFVVFPEEVSALHSLRELRLMNCLFAGHPEEISYGQVPECMSTLMALSRLDLERCCFWEDFDPTSLRHLRGLKALRINEATHMAARHLRALAGLTALRELFIGCAGACR